MQGTRPTHLTGSLWAIPSGSVWVTLDTIHPPSPAPASRSTGPAVGAASAGESSFPNLTPGPGVRRLASKGQGWTTAASAAS